MTDNTKITEELAISYAEQAFNALAAYEGPENDRKNAQRCYKNGAACAGEGDIKNAAFFYKLALSFLQEA